MSKYNYTESCIKKFMEQLEISKQLLGPSASDDFKKGFNHASDLAQIWFNDLIVEIQKEQEVQL